MTNLVKEVKSYNKYPNELKRKIAIDYLSGRYSYRILAEKNNLKDKTVVKEFVKWYRKQLEKTIKPIVSMPTIEEKSPKDNDLSNRVKELEEKLKLAELKVEGLETMIDIAEEMLKIDIRKKSGAKQSKK